MTRQNTSKKNRLTPKQERFCQEYMVDLNATQAAIRAGYSDKAARAISSRLLTKDNIKARIERMKAKVADFTEVTVKEVIDGLREVSERCMQRKPVLTFNYKTKRLEQKTDENGEGIWEFDSHGANKSLELLGKHIGTFTDKIKHEGTLTNQTVYIVSNEKTRKQLEKIK